MIPRGACMTSPDRNQQPAETKPIKLLGMEFNDRALWIVMFIIASTVVVLAIRGFNDMRDMQREFARRVADSDARVKSAEIQQREAVNALGEVNKRIASLEARLSESQNQQVALEQLYQDLLRNRDDVQLAEIEQVISTAVQQLQLFGNVEAALVAMQNIETRLARIDKPQFLGIRRAVAHDLERLRALPSIDISGAAIKLDQLVTQVDALPALADARPASDERSANEQTDAADAKNAGRGWFMNWWSRMRERVAQEFGSLVRINKANSVDALLVAPSQTYFLRENIKLRLLSARQQLIARNEVGFRNELQVVRAAVGKYLDPQARTTQQYENTLKALQTMPIAIDLPTLSESLNAVRNFRPSGGVFPVPRSNDAPNGASPAPVTPER